jgi:hypothetical protein
VVQTQILSTSPGRSGVPGRMQSKFTVSKAVDRSRRIRTEEIESALAVQRAAVTQRRAVSVE